MTDETITLAIEKLAGLGDGVGQAQGQRVFVPYTLPGDRVRARIIRVTKDAAYAGLEEVITPGAGRIQPVCRHFARCGGCALQHVNDALYEDFKQQAAREAVKKGGFDPACVQKLVRLAAASRRRVEIKVADGRLGYYERQSHRLVEIEECKVLEPGLEALILRLKPWALSVPGLKAIQINGVDEGYDIALSAEDSGPWQLPADVAIRRISLRQGAHCRTLQQSGPVTLTLGTCAAEVPPGAFLQASREAQAIMTRQVTGMVGEAARVLDLFAGIGTYSFPLAARAQVTAFEGDGAMVNAMQRTARRHAMEKNLEAHVRDLFRDPVEAFKGIDAVVINPPRIGAKAQVEKLARSPVKKLVMVSCNPATFSRDARILKDGGYSLIQVLPIDQFVYSAHLEMIAEFIR